MPDSLPVLFRQRSWVKGVPVYRSAGKDVLTAALGEVFLDFRLGIMRISPKIVGFLDSLSEEYAGSQSVGPRHGMGHLDVNNVMDGNFQ